jgi:hypothetical protein
LDKAWLQIDIDIKKDMTKTLTLFRIKVLQG